MFVSVALISAFMVHQTRACICTMQYDPVCCDNNQEYGNQCQANCDSATNCVPGVCLTDAVGCDGICTSFYDGCNNCQCNDDGLAGCTKMACLTQGTPECLACADGYALNLITKECEASSPSVPSCGGIPFCQSFQMDFCNACGCPDPVSSPDVSYCTKMACQLREKNVCTACMDGYELNNDGAECVKPAPTPEPCICTKQYEPVCCNGQVYGNQCAADCAGETACQDGECAADTTASRVSCADSTECEDPFTCKKNPECRGSQLMCANDKVCQQVDGQCTSQDDCQAGFECMRRKANANRKFCIQFQ